MRGTPLVLDLETQKTFDEIGSRNPSDLLISVVGVYRFDTDSYHCYRESELPILENLMIDSPLIIGYNHRKFDMPVLQHYFRINTAELPLLDLMEDIAIKIGHRVGLDSVAQATLNIGKTGHGLDAIDYFKKGEWEKLESYCINDVRITKDVFEYGQKNNKVFYLSKDGSIRREVNVDWQLPDTNQQQAIANQYNLGF